jgi:hypothetical protein
MYNGIIFLLIFYTYYNTIFTPFYAQYVSIVRLLPSLVCDIYLQSADTVPIALRPLPRQKSTKIESKTAYKLSSIGRCYYRYREKSRQGPTRYRVFFAAEVP